MRFVAEGLKVITLSITLVFMVIISAGLLVNYVCSKGGKRNPKPLHMLKASNRTCKIIWRSI